MGVLYGEEWDQRLLLGFPKALFPYIREKGKEGDSLENLDFLTMVMSRPYGGVESPPNIERGSNHRHFSSPCVDWSSSEGSGALDDRPFSVPRRTDSDASPPRRFDPKIPHIYPFILFR